MSLPVRYGGISTQSALYLASSAYLAFAAGSSDLAQHVLPLHLQSAPHLNMDDVIGLWSKGLDQTFPEGVASHRQRSWDT